ncbi:MAG: S8 family serine peptidase [Chitinophagaceae bacterium]
MTAAGNRPDGISSNDGYDIVSSYGTAKNILTIGAVNPISSGYSRSTDVVLSDFSSWGPTDDGRIKPDVVADGINVLSSWGGGDNEYSIQQGTSMSTPNASGSLLLLQEYYSQLHGGTFMRAATLKGLAIHTADEAGPAAGPDYQYGWGLLNMKKAAAVITANNTTHLIQENVLNNSGTLSIPVIASGNGTIKATISWTDPKAPVEPEATALNNHTKKLVNDLDIVIKKGATIYRPWRLDPANPANNATTGDNTIDNIEKVELTDVVPGDTYTIEISHKGTLERGSQAYSLIVSGVGSQTYCTSGPTSTAGARIDSISFSNVQNKNTAGCKDYSNFKSLTATVQPNQTLPFFIRLNSCDATSVDKMAKVYIDANNDGDFTDAGENVGTSGVVNGNGDITNLNITIPAGLAPGQYAILRVVMQETNSAAAISPCGTYAKGETQDYRIFVSSPAVDAGISELTSPLAGECGTGEQYAAVRIKNIGTTSISNVPVSVIVKQGATTVATLNGTFSGTIPAGADVEYTLQTPFVMAANTAYSFTATAAVSGDQVATNNQLVSSITTGANAPAPTGTANVCGTTVTLTATSSALNPFNWYGSASATTPLASGSPTTTSTIQSTYYLSSGEVNKKLGPETKLTFADGSYGNNFGPGIRFTTSIPTTLKTARLYIGHPGKIIFNLREVVNFNETDGSYNYYAISSKTLNVTASAPTPPPLTTQINDPSDPGAIYNLGIDIPDAANYILAIEYADGSSIYRNNLITGANYPYTIPGVITMTGNTVVTVSPNAQAYYYYLYNLAVKPSIGCPSPRTAITATSAAAPTITVAGNVLTSSAGLAYQWYVDNVPIPAAINQSYTAVASGSYTVEVTNASNCTLKSAATAVNITAVPNVDPTEIAFTVTPNPSKGQFTIKLETRTKADMDISLMSTSGQRVYNTSIPGFIGKLTKLVEQPNLSAGVYYLRIIHDKKMYIQKVVIVQ